MNKNIVKHIVLLALLVGALFLYVGCVDEETVMPYGSSDYENGEWTVDDIVNHLKDLGFDDVNIKETDSRYVSKLSIDVRVEDTESDSWFTEYTDFVKGEPVRSWREVVINVTHPIPVLTTENTPELAEKLALRDGTDAEIEQWESFMQTHNGEYIEFNGTVLNVYDGLFYVSGITLGISFEEYSDISFEWSNIEPNDIGYDNDYYSGCLPKGSSVYCVVKIVCSEDECIYELDTLKTNR